MLTGTINVQKDRRYSIKEACRILGICRTTMYTYIHIRKIIYPEIHEDTGKIFFTGEELRRFWNNLV